MTLLTAARRSAGAATALVFAAMFFYPGGNYAHRGATRYSFSQNFLSDLGSSVAYNRAPNAVSARLFVAALAVLVFALAACLAGLVQVHSRPPAARPWARGGAAAGVVACVSLVGVGLAPVDRFLHVHELLTYGAIGPLPLVALLLGIAAWRDGRFPPRALVAWGTLAFGLAIYVVILLWGPSIRTALGLTIEVSSQKAAVIAAVSILSYQSWEADRVLARPDTEAT